MADRQGPIVRRIPIARHFEIFCGSGADVVLCNRQSHAQAVDPLLAGDRMLRAAGAGASPQVARTCLRYSRSVGGFPAGAHDGRRPAF
jgi:hypothetical protein